MYTQPSVVVQPPAFFSSHIVHISLRQQLSITRQFSILPFQNSRSKGSTTGEFTNSTAIYNGGACRSALSCLLQEMDLLPNNGIICISSAVDQGETEANAKLLLSLLHKTVDTRCQLDQVRPFACLFLFPLASSCNSSRDNPDPVQIYRPSKKSCEHIRDELCPKTWQRFSISARVDCNTLPSSGLDLNEPSCTGRHRLWLLNITIVRLDQ